MGPLLASGLLGVTGTRIQPIIKPCTFCHTWLIGQQIAGVISFQEIFGLFGLKDHVVEKKLDVAIVTERQTNENVRIVLEFFSHNSQFLFELKIISRTLHN